MENCITLKSIGSFLVISGGLISGLVLCLLWNELKFYKRHNWDTDRDSGQNIFLSHIYMIVFFFMNRRKLRMWSKLTALIGMLGMGLLFLAFGFGVLVK